MSMPTIAKAQKVIRFFTVSLPVSQRHPSRPLQPI
jgi:hypothetical protein